MKQAGISWEGKEGISWEGRKGISWEGISWESISWEGISWEDISWEGRKCKRAFHGNAKGVLVIQSPQRMWSFRKQTRDGRVNSTIQ